MPNTVSFNAITLSSKHRIPLGPPDFKKLRVIRIGELRALGPDEVPASTPCDGNRLRNMSADVEQLEIGVLTLLRGGLKIQDVAQIQMRHVFAGIPLHVHKADVIEVHNEFDVNLDPGETAVEVDATRGRISVRHADEMHIENLFTGPGSDIAEGQDVVLILPRHVEPTRKWAPVRVPPRVKLTAG
jgi:hypothetical protein